MAFWVPFSHRDVHPVRTGALEDKPDTNLTGVFHGFHLILSGLFHLQMVKSMVFHMVNPIHLVHLVHLVHLSSLPEACFPCAMMRHVLR